MEKFLIQSISVYKSIGCISILVLEMKYTLYLLNQKDENLLQYNLLVTLWESASIKKHVRKNTGIKLCFYSTPKNSTVHLYKGKVTQSHYHGLKLNGVR